MNLGENFFKENLLKPLITGLTFVYPLIIGIIFHQEIFMMLSFVGAIAFLIVSNKSYIDNIKSVTIHGISVMIGFILGLFIAYIPWALPFFISLIAYLGYSVENIYRAPPPSYSFVLTMFAVATSIILPLTLVPLAIEYIILGIIYSLINVLIYSYILKLPFKNKPSIISQMNIKEKINHSIKQKPEIFIRAIMLSFIFFVIGYIAFLLKDQRGFWLIISASSILVGDSIESYTKRTKHRIFGGIIGIGIGFVITLFNLPFNWIMVIIILLIVGLCYFIPKNYFIANFFINSMVILVCHGISYGLDIKIIIIDRIIGIILGSIIALVLAWILNESFKTFLKSYNPEIE
jgi:hypothetical protein